MKKSLPEGTKLRIKRDCECAHDRHEMDKYPREGLTVQAFDVGQEFEVIRQWQNFFGDYYRVKTPKGHADIEIKNAELI